MCHPTHSTPHLITHARCLVGINAIEETCHSNHPYFQQLVQDVEAAMLEADSQLAVYLAYETPELLDIYRSVRAASDTHTASSAAAGQTLTSINNLVNSDQDIAETLHHQ